jgi:hypothetical protein
MQAYKLKGNIDPAGNLRVIEPIKMPPGDVEIIVLQTVEQVTSSTSPITDSQATKPKRTVECPIPILKEWLEKTEPAPADFNAEQARWEGLKEKHL